MENTLPSRIELYYSDLPKANRARVVALGRDSSNVRRAGNPAPTGMFLGAIALGALIFMKFNSFMPLVFILAGALTWLIGTRIIAPSLFFSPFHYVHSAFVLDAGYGLLVAYPIWHLSSVEVTHHLRLGSYRHSDVKLTFGSDIVSMVAQTSEQAQALAKLALLHRDHALKLQGLNALESVEEYDLIPASAVSPGSKTSRAYFVLGAAVIAGLIAIQMASRSFIGF